MKRAPAALRLGAFVIGGLALLLFAVVTVSGGMLFSRHERVVMHFEGSVYGLQVGAPVVFRGVRVGRVVAITLTPDAQGRFRAPVQADLDLDLMLPPGAPTLAALVQQGLVAQLANQSLLTGLLYVDMTLSPAVMTRAAAAPPDDRPIEIPTAAAPMQALVTQLQTLDLAGLISNLDALAVSTRTLVETPALQQGLAEFSALATELRALTTRLDRRVDPLTGAGEATLAQAQAALLRLGAAAEAITQAAQATQQGVDRLVDASTPALASTRQAADELARSATALRSALDDESALMQGVQRGSQDVARAARALRDLAELLERQPQAVLRGRQDPP
jgi:paraquat-inducible protein B